MKQAIVLLAALAMFYPAIGGAGGVRATSVTSSKSHSIDRAAGAPGTAVRGSRSNSSE